MRKIFLIAMSQLGAILVGSALYLKYPSAGWQVGLLTGFFTGSVPVFYMFLVSIKNHKG